MTRYVIEKIAKQPDMRRVKDTLRNRYLKQPHGSDVWPIKQAETKLAELNALASAQPA